MSRLKVATVGAGYFSRFHHDAWTRMPEVELVAICDRDLDKATAFQERFAIPHVFADPAEMLAETKPDLLDIAVPPTGHLELIKLAAEAGVPAICQKPFCQTLAEAEEAVAIAAKAGTLLVVHENFRFQPWYGELKRQLDAGALGEVYQIGFRLRPGDGQGPEAYLDRQPYFQTMRRFLVHETAIHFIDIFRYLMGEVDWVFADLRRLNPAIAGEDAGVILFGFESGARGLFDGNRLVDHVAENRRYTMGELLLEGEKGVLRLDGEGHVFLRGHGSNSEQPVAWLWPEDGFAGDCVRALQQHVVDHLLRGGPVVNTGADYLANLRLEAAVYASAESGRRERPVTG